MSNDPMHPVVRAVVLDVGGVLLEWDPNQVYRPLIPDAETRRWFLTEVCTIEWNLELDAGRSFDEACDELAARHPDHAEWVHAWKRQEEMIVGEVPGAMEIVRALRHVGVPIFLLTNMPADVFAMRRERFEILRMVDGAVVSGEEGIVKPSPEIFARLTERFGLDPAETLFVDDTVANVSAAQASGYKCHHFTTAAALRDELVSLGFPV